MNQNKPRLIRHWFEKSPPKVLPTLRHETPPHDPPKRENSLVYATPKLHQASASASRRQRAVVQAKRKTSRVAERGRARSVRRISSVIKMQRRRLDLTDVVVHQVVQLWVEASLPRQRESRRDTRTTAAASRWCARRRCSSKSSTKCSSPRKLKPTGRWGRCCRRRGGGGAQQRLDVPRVTGWPPNTGSGWTFAELRPAPGVEEVEAPTGSWPPRDRAAKRPQTDLLPLASHRSPCRPSPSCNSSSRAIILSLWTRARPIHWR